MTISQSALRAALLRLARELYDEGHIQAHEAVTELLTSSASVGRLATILNQTFKEPEQ